MGFREGKQIWYAVKNVNSYILYTAFTWKSEFWERKKPVGPWSLCLWFNLIQSMLFKYIIETTFLSCLSVDILGLVCNVKVALTILSFA